MPMRQSSTSGAHGFGGTLEMSDKKPRVLLERGDGGRVRAGGAAYNAQQQLGHHLQRDGARQPPDIPERRDGAHRSSRRDRARLQDDLAEIDALLGRPLPQDALVHRIVGVGIRSTEGRACDVEDRGEHLLSVGAERRTEARHHVLHDEIPHNVPGTGECPREDVALEQSARMGACAFARSGDGGALRRDVIVQLEGLVVHIAQLLPRVDPAGSPAADRAVVGKGRVVVLDQRLGAADVSRCGGLEEGKRMDLVVDGSCFPRPRSKELVAWEFPSHGHGPSPKRRLRRYHVGFLDGDLDDEMRPIIERSKGEIRTLAEGEAARALEPRARLRRAVLEARAVEGSCHVRGGLIRSSRSRGGRSCSPMRWGAAEAPPPAGALAWARRPGTRPSPPARRRRPRTPQRQGCARDPR